MKRQFILVFIALFFCAIPAYAQPRPKIDRSQSNTSSKSQQTKSKTSSKSSSQGKTQAQQFSISPTSATFLATGGSKTFTVYSSKDWDISVSTESWAHLERQGNALKLTVDANDGYQRDDYFTIISGEKTITVTFTQEQTDFLSVSSESLNFTASGGTQTITVNSSKPWTIGTKTYGWGHLNISGNQLTVKIDAYTGTSNRTDYFTIKSGGLEKRVNITQEAQKTSKSAIINDVTVSNNANVDGKKGLSIKVSFDVDGMKEKDGRIICYFYDSEGNALLDLNDNYGTVGTPSKVAVGKSITPNVENAKYTDFELKIPYDELHLSESGTRTLRVDVLLWDKSETPNKVLAKKNNTYFTCSPSNPYLKIDGSISDRTKYFEGTGGREDYSVSTSASSYEIWGLPSWCRIENKTSSGFTLVCETNPNYSSRNDYFKVKADGKEVRIDVQQAARSSVSSTSGASRTKNTRYRGRDYYRFPTGGEWQSMIGFNAGVIGHYHSPVDVYNGTIGLFTGKGLHFEENSSFAWDLSYIGGGLFSKCFFVGFGLGVSGYANKAMHKNDITLPLYLHVKWYMAGNSAVSPYIATSQGIDFYICQDYAQTRLLLGPHSRFDLGIHIRPDLYSKFGISIACEFGFAPYRITEVLNYTYRYISSISYGNEEIGYITLQSFRNKTYSHATYMGGYISIAF